MNTNEVRMVRYGRVDGAPKNVLYTIRKGETIYFGISRCNTSHDSFRKTNGKLIASERALLAEEEVSENQVSDFALHKSGLRGVCSKEKVVEMLKYFDFIDRIMFDRSAKGKKQRKKVEEYNNDI
jgi:hypothetical protein